MQTHLTRILLPGLAALAAIALSLHLLRDPGTLTTTDWAARLSIAKIACEAVAGIRKWARSCEAVAAGLGGWRPLDLLGAKRTAVVALEDKQREKDDDDGWTRIPAGRLGLLQGNYQPQDRSQVTGT